MIPRLSGAAAKRLLRRCGIRVLCRKSGPAPGGEAALLIEVQGLPPGLGSCMHWDRRLGGRLAKALFSLAGVRGAAVGLGFACASRPGSQVHDAFAWQAGRVRYLGNNSGGLDGGMTTGEPLLLRADLAPGAALRPAAAADAVAAVLGGALLEKTGLCSGRELPARVQALRNVNFVNA